ncbi:hypothetical protein, partial [Flavihumibacter sp. CACIAM 22H1]|uniref:hypothetical protein n=1 Tax=Flavihumibacter sp. CACIAM 22H1 TaxID=1812911 RepID=UPI0025C1D3AF
LVDRGTKKRLLPVFYDDNYISILPGQTKKISMEFSASAGSKPLVAVEGWNLPEQFIEVQGSQY